MTDVIQDAIEDTIEIDAPAEQVWPLISEPGWWINDGSYRDHTEFWIDERPGGVTLRVRESGFAGLAGEQTDILQQIDDNTSGWRTELTVAKSTVEDRRRSA